MWKLEGYAPVANQIQMRRYNWYIKERSLEKAISEAHKLGARNIFRVVEVVPLCPENQAPQ